MKREKSPASEKENEQGNCSCQDKFRAWVPRSENIKIQYLTIPRQYNDTDPNVMRVLRNKIKEARNKTQELVDGKYEIKYVE